MKIGKMEGSPEEIRNFIENNGLNIEDYLEQPQPPLRRVWLIIPACLVVASLFWLTLFTPSSIAFLTFIFLIGFGGGIWLAVSVQIRFENSWATTIVAVGTLLMMLVAIGVLSPAEMLQYLKEFEK